jgi:hypothetical protein
MYNIFVWPVCLHWCFGISVSSQLTGPIVPDLSFSTLWTQLNLANNANLTCPIMLAAFGRLSQLHIQHSGFEGCDFMDASQVQLPSALTFLDISDNSWALMYLSPPATLVTLRARNASLVGVMLNFGLYVLTTLVLDDNDLSVEAHLLPKFWLQSGIQTISCQRCNLGLSVMDITRGMGGLDANLQVLLLAQNNLFGSMPAAALTWSLLQPPITTGAPGAPTWPPTMTQLDLSGNPRIIGVLPPAGQEYTDLQVINLSNTSLSGPIPLSWANFPALQTLNLQNVGVTCQLEQTASGALQCTLPPFLIQMSTVSQLLLPDGSFQPGVHCPTLGLRGRAVGDGDVKVDPSYYARTRCTCDAGFFVRVATHNYVIWIMLL